MSTKVADIFAELGIHVPPGEMKKAEAKLQAFGAKADQNFKKLGSKVAMHVGGMVAAFAGFQKIKQGVVDAFQFDESLDRLSIASKGAIGNVEAFKNRIVGASNETGVARESLLEAAHAFVAFTGKGDVAKESLKAFAKIAQATDTPVTDIAKAAGALANNFGITGAQMEKTFSILTEGGKEGAVELSDMASLLAPVTAQFQNFADMKGLEGVAKLGAAFQLTMRGSGSPAEAATRMESLAVALQKKASKIKDTTGIDVGQMLKTDGFSKTMDKLDQAIKSKKLSDEDVIDMFGRQEAVVAFRQITKLQGEYSKLTAKIQQSNSVSEDFATVQEKQWFKVKQRLNELKNAFLNLMAKLTPAVTWLIKNLEMLLIPLGAMMAMLAVNKISKIANGLGLIGIQLQKIGLKGRAGAAAMSSFGAAAKANAAIAGLAIGAMIGTFIDQHTGFSDWLSDKAAGRDPNKNNITPEQAKNIKLLRDRGLSEDEAIRQVRITATNEAARKRTAEKKGDTYVTINAANATPEQLEAMIKRQLDRANRQAAAAAGGGQ